MLIGLIIYLSGRRHLPPDTIVPRGKRAKLTAFERRRVVSLLALLLVPYMIAGVAQFQAYGIMYTWADTVVDRKVLGWEVPVTWIGVADGLFTILGVMFASWLWRRLEARGREPHDLVKMAIGYAILTSAWLIAAAMATLPVVPVLLWILFFLVMDFSFAFTEPPTQSLISRDAPLSMTATMMAILKSMTMIGYFLIGWLGRFYEPLGPAWFWLLTGGFAFAALIAQLLMRPWLLKRLEPEHASDRPVVAG